MMGKPIKPWRKLCRLIEVKSLNTVFRILIDGDLGVSRGLVRSMTYIPVVGHLFAARIGLSLYMMHFLLAIITMQLSS